MTKVNKIRLSVAAVSVLFVLLAGTFLLRGSSLRRSSKNKRAEIVKQETSRVEEITASVGSQQNDDEPAEAVEKVPPQQLADDDRFSNLELPTPYEDRHLDLPIVGIQLVEMWKDIDSVMNAWPAYSDLKPELLAELRADLGFEKLPDGELVKTAVEFRDRYWEAGGEQSDSAYRQAYRARLLLEYAHERNPGNLEVVDELVETIQAANVLRNKFNPQLNSTGRNDEIMEILRNLRREQFAIIRNQVEQGHKPTLQGFVCACDLAFLQQGHDKTAAIETVRWLRSNAREGGWSRNDRTLAQFENALKQGTGYGFQIYVALGQKPANRSRYTRRAPSFRGPKERKAVLSASLDEEYFSGGKKVTNEDGSVTITHVMTRDQ